MILKSLMLSADTPMPVVTIRDILLALMASLFVCHIHGHFPWNIQLGSAIVKGVPKRKLNKANKQQTRSSERCEMEQWLARQPH